MLPTREDTEKAQYLSEGLNLSPDSAICLKLNDSKNNIINYHWEGNEGKDCLGLSGLKV